jgi:hypothetical protein
MLISVGTIPIRAAIISRQGWMASGCAESRGDWASTEVVGDEGIGMNGTFLTGVRSPAPFSPGQG